MKYLFDLWDDFISLLFPRICYACGTALMRNEKIICTDCYVSIPRSNFHIKANNIVEQTFWGRCKLERASVFSFYNKDSRIRKLVHNMKYNGIREIGGELGKIYGNELKNSGFLEGIDMIVPVPLHPIKERKRGFNQTMEIANGLSSSTGLPIGKDILIKTSLTQTQTKRNRLERWENVEGTFGITDYSRIDGKHILLVDDIITTGATIESCATLLLDGTDISVSVIALAATIN